MVSMSFILIRVGVPVARWLDLLSCNYLGPHYMS